MNDGYEGEQPLWINTEAMLANRAGAEASGIAMNLIMRVWWPTKQPFTFDPEALAARFNAQVPARGYTAAKIEKRRKAIATFFTVLPDGRWAPSPEYFSLTDGNPGGRAI